MIVFDASALLASVQREPGWEAVDEALDAAAISAVNYSEVLTRMIEGGIAPDEAVRSLGGLDLRVEPFNQKISEIAALLRPETRRAGLSLGDRACLALAKASGAPVLTADRAWTRIDVGVEIRLIR